MGQTAEAMEYDVGGAVVHPWHIDQFGHMNVRWYAHFFDDASFQFLDLLGLTRPSGNAHCVTARTATEFHAELVAGACLRVRASVARIGGKSVTLRYRLIGARDGQHFASCETVDVFVDAVTHQPIDIPAEIRTALEQHQAGGTDTPVQYGENA